MVFPNYKIGNYEEAIKLLKEIMKTKNDMEYVNGLGELLIKTEKYQEFIDIVNKIMKNESKPLKAMPLDIIYKYGECLFKVTEYLKAEQCFDIILTHNIIQVSDLVRSVGLLYEKNMMQNKALRYYLILVNNTLNQAENDVENSEDDDEPELKPEGEKKIPFEIEMDILKCGQIYQSLEKPNDAERILLKGLEYFKDSYEIRKALSDIYRAKGDAKAAINITAIKREERNNGNKDNSDSDYNPSEDNEDSGNKSIDDDSDEDIANDVSRKRPSRSFNLKFKQNKRFKIDEDLDENKLNEKLSALKKSIYEDYNHGEIILNLEQAKIHYENNSSSKLISILTPTVSSIIKRHFEIDMYVNLLKAEHELKFKAENEYALDHIKQMNGEPLFIQNQSAHKVFESERMRKEKKLNFERISTELEKLPNLYAELNERAFEDCIYKLLSEIVLNDKWKEISDEMIDNMRELEMFNRYPESPKVLMIYICIFIILYKKENYRECYRIIKRLCRNFSNTKLFWGAFSSVCSKLPRYSLEKVAINQENTEFEYQQKHFSYRGHVQRMMDKYFKGQTVDQSSTLSLLQILLGNNYTQSRNYETAMTCYEKALESVECKDHNPLIYLLISACFLKWTTSRTNFDKLHTAIMAFKYLKIYDLKKKGVKSNYSIADSLEFEYNIARATSVRIHCEVKEQDNYTDLNERNKNKNESKVNKKLQSLNSQSFDRFQLILSKIPENYEGEDKERIDRIKRLCSYNLSQILCRGNMPKSTSSQNQILIATEEAQQLLFNAIEF